MRAGGWATGKLLNFSAGRDASGVSIFLGAFVGGRAVPQFLFSLLSHDPWFSESGEYSGWVGGPPFPPPSFCFIFSPHLHGLLPLFEVRHPHLTLYSSVTQRQPLAESLNSNLKSSALARVTSKLLNFSAEHDVTPLASASSLVRIVGGRAVLPVSLLFCCHMTLGSQRKR